MITSTTTKPIPVRHGRRGAMRKTLHGCVILALACAVPAWGDERRPAPTATVYAAWPFDAREAARRQEETAKALGTAKELALDLDSKNSMTLVLIPAGKFVMGSPETEKDRLPVEGPQHPVTLTKPYYLGQTEVTQAQYEAVMGKNPSAFKAPTQPVDSVTWSEAAEFCKKVAEKTGKTVRLPTEAEWENACRAGTATAYSGSGNQAAYIWSEDNAGKKTQPVGLKQPNPFGLYDLHGNVWEWCSDWYAERYDVPAAAVDPQGPATGQKRAVRGGAWASRLARCSSACRGGREPGSRANFMGLRIVVEATGSK